MSGDKLVAAAASDGNKEKAKSKTNAATVEDNRFELPAGGGTDQPDVVDSNGASVVVVDARTAVGDIISPGGLVDGAGSGNSSISAGDAITVGGDIVETKLK